jgi:hypothetical protein
VSLSIHLPEFAFPIQHHPEKDVAFEIERSASLVPAMPG